jgi:hypothetical protein
VEKVNLAHKLSLFSDHYSPRIVGEVNDSYVKLVKLQGKFVCKRQRKTTVDESSPPPASKRDRRLQEPSPDCRPLARDPGQL